MEDEWRFVCRHGYHVYRDMWDPYVGNSFTTKHERNNQHDNNITLTIIHPFLYDVHETFPIFGTV